MTIPANISPMLASDGFKAFDDEDWLFELKYDGFRIIAYIEKSIVKLRTRNNKDYTKKFPPVAEALSKLKGEAIIDGEVVVLNDEGNSDFKALMSWKRGSGVPIYYYVFDLLYYNGKDYMSLPLSKRKAALKAIMPRSKVIRYCSDITGFGIAAFKMAVDNNLEGIVAKRRDSVYRPGMRSKDWLKIKTYKEEEFAIVGYTRGPFALLLGRYEDNMLVFAGEVGTGFSNKQVKEILSRITVVKKCPLVKEPVFKAGSFGKKPPESVTWCRPELVARVRYLEATKGALRHASFKGFN